MGTSLGPPKLGCSASCFSSSGFRWLTARAGSDGSRMRAMGILRSAAGELAPLLPDTLLGRSERTDVRVDDRAVSAEHARLRWTTKRPAGS